MAEAAIRRVGVVGLGRMGRPIARRLLAAGFDVLGADPSAEARDAARAAGVAAAPLPELAGRVDLALVLVGFEREAEAVILGPEGLAEHGRAGLTVGLASTVAPGFARALPRRAARTDLRFLDMPLARGEAAAEAGRLLAYVGGEAADVARARPALDAFCEAATHLGPLGAGQAAKAANNMLLWACVTASTEALDWGEAQGLDREALRAALLLGSGDNWAMRTRADERPALWAEKDMAIALDEADRTRTPMPVMGVVREAIKAFKLARGLPAPRLDD